MSPSTESRWPWRAGDEPSGAILETASNSTAIWVIATLLLGLVGTSTALRVANNIPGSLPPGVAAIRALLADVGPTMVAVVVVALALVVVDERTRVGLAFAGVFGLLGLHVPAATLPAVAGIGGGTALVVSRIGVADEFDRVTAVVVVVWLGVALSLAGATGVLDAAVRSIASTVALVGLAVLPLASDPSRTGWLAGGAVAAVVLWAGATAPFVTGAVVLVGAGAVGVPLVVLAGGTGGSVAALVGAATTGRWRVALAVGLLLAAGVPATLPRALAAGAALAMLAGGDLR